MSSAELPPLKPFSFLLFWLCQKWKPELETFWEFKSRPLIFCYFVSKIGLFRGHLQMSPATLMITMMSETSWRCIWGWSKKQIPVPPCLSPQPEQWNQTDPVRQTDSIVGPEGTAFRVALSAQGAFKETPVHSVTLAHQCLVQLH